MTSTPDHHTATEGSSAAAHDGLNERQRRFVEAYMGEHAGNATRAYMTAYGVEDEGAAATLASRLVRVSKVRAAIDERIDDDPLVAKRHEVMLRLSRIVRGEERAHIELRTDADGGALRVEVTGSRVADEIRAAELLLKIHGALVEKHEHTGKDGGPIGVESGGGLSAATIEKIRREALGLRQPTTASTGEA